MSLTFRGASPEDAQAAVPLIHASGTAALEFAFASPRLACREFLLAAFAAGRGPFGWRCHRVALDGGEVVGIAAFFGAADCARLDRELAAQAIGLCGLSAGLGVLRRALALRALMPAPPRGAGFVSQLAVREDRRGRGVGRGLLADAQAEARARGLASLVLDVAEDNPRACSLYRSFGFAEVSRQRFRGPAGRVPDHIRLAKSLVATEMP